MLRLVTLLSLFNTMIDFDHDEELHAHDGEGPHHVMKSPRCCKGKISVIAGQLNKIARYLSISASVTQIFVILSTRWTVGFQKPISAPACLSRHDTVSNVDGTPVSVGLVHRVLIRRRLDNNKLETFPEEIFNRMEDLKTL